MRPDDPLPRFLPVHIQQMRASLPLFVSETGSLLLPDLILWAFHLNEGDLLTVSREAPDTFRCRFESFGDAIRTLADWDPAARWPFLEAKLRLPMAAMGSQGEILLPEEAAPLARPGAPVLLVVPSLLETGFTLEPGGRRVSPGVFLEAGYSLPLEAGAHVYLPADVLWLAGLQEGDVLACRTSPGQADFEPLAQIEPLRGRTLIQLGPRGRLRVPDPFLRDLKPDWRLRLTVTFKPEAAFRLSFEV